MQTQLVAERRQWQEAQAHAALEQSAKLSESTRTCTVLTETKYQLEACRLRRLHRLMCGRRRCGRWCPS